jgi:hypothetical protein
VKTDTHPSATTADVLLSAALCAAAFALVIAATALAIVASGLAGDLRRLLGFNFAGVEHTPAQAASIALHNARLAAGTLLFAGARPRLTPAARRALDALLTALLVLNAGAVGLALGAYGARLAAVAWIHLRLELAALSLAGGAYLQARKHALNPRVLATVAAICAALLALAATLETYSPPGGLR